MSVLALIPARGGSKGVKRKNLHTLRGKPLIYWTIKAAQSAPSVNEVVVSTDHLETADVARSFGVTNCLIRPAELAEDSTPGVMPVLHAAQRCPEFDWILLLQPTSPLRSSADIEAMLQFQRASGADSVVSVCAVQENPYLFFRMDANSTLSPLLAEAFSMKRRQDMPKFHRLNGAMYLVRRSWLLEHRTLVGTTTLGFEMPLERSIDIDQSRDFDEAELLMKESNE